MIINSLYRYSITRMGMAKIGIFKLRTQGKRYAKNHL